MTNPYGVALAGNDLFVANNGGTISEYTTAGASVNASLVSGLSFPTFLEVEPVPEPSASALLTMASGVPLLSRKP